MKSQTEGSSPDRESLAYSEEAKPALSLVLVLPHPEIRTH